MATKTEAVAAFLKAKTHADLAELYSYNMECQVNVAQDGGTLTSGEYKGKRWRGWTDGVTTWKPFRIPWNAATVAEYTDSDVKFDFDAHVEAIGMTGWDWVNKVSRWFAFDFDDITGHAENHSKKLTDDELQELKTVASQIPWVTVRHSSGGKGLHLYITLATPEPTATHTEHAALGRAILGKLSAFAKYDFAGKVDTCGGNMWVWHRKMSDTCGLTLIKAGEPLDKIPDNWKNHVNPVRKISKKMDPVIPINSFEELCGKLNYIPLDDEHKKLFTFLEKSGATWSWDQDRHMLVCHTSSLAAAHSELKLKGVFTTLSKGTEQGDQNAFGFPLREGGWIIRRFSPGCAETKTWFTDNVGWTKCFYNKLPNLKIAALSCGGLENESGAYVFLDPSKACEALRCLGIDETLPERYRFARETELLTDPKEVGRIIFRFTYQDGDSQESMVGWLPLTKKKKWVKIYRLKEVTTDNDSKNYDNILRHLVSENGDDCGWLIRPSERDIWRNEPINHVRAVMESLGHGPKDVTNIVGSTVLNCWVLVNRPFGPEYIGNRQWNLNAAKLKFTPSTYSDNLSYPSWDSILSHIGKELDHYIQNNSWCKANGVLSGRDYLKIWIANLFQNPLEPLPYLFLYGEQNTGKSILHEALSLLMTKGYQRADIALTNDSSFNGELENAVLCVVEETDISKHRGAYNKIKDWVTSRQLNIRALYTAPKHVTNSTHWIQCANDHTACPIFPGDTRITMIRVKPLDPIDLVPKRQLITLLEKEAPDFLSEILHLELPTSNDRLALPVIETSDKATVGARNQSSLQRFLSEHCLRVPGAYVKFSDFCEKFYMSMESDEISHWTKQRVSRELPPDCPNGRLPSAAGDFYIGNLKLIDSVSDIAEEKGGSYELVRDDKGFLKPRSLK